MWRTKDLTGKEQVWYNSEDVLDIIEEACDLLGLSFHAKVEIKTEVERVLADESDDGI